jgi:hypothetical protein
VPDEPKDLRFYKYILWTDHGGYEGWHPSGFDDAGDMIEYILRGEAYGNRMLLTRPAELAMAAGDAD